MQHSRTLLYGHRNTHPVLLREPLALDGRLYFASSMRLLIHDESTRERAILNVTDTHDFSDNNSFANFTDPSLR